jgi:MFS family permease
MTPIAEAPTATTKRAAKREANAANAPVASHVVPRAKSVNDRRWAILAVLCLSLFVAVLDGTIMNATLSSLVPRLGETTSQLHWIVDAFVLVFAGFVGAARSLADRFGRKPALLVGLALLAVFSALASITQTSGQLIAARALMGIGAALIFPTTLAILCNVFTDAKERANAISVWSAVTGAAVAVGPVVGEYLLGHFWWGSGLLINIPICAVAIVLAARIVPNSKDEHSPGLAMGGLILSMLAIGTLVYTIIEAPQVGWTSNRTVYGFALGAAACLAFVCWDYCSEYPMLDIAAFRNIRFSAARISIGAAVFAVFALLFMATPYL